MAKAQNPPGPRQVFKDLIDRISFPPVLGGTLFIYYNYQTGMQGDTQGRLTSPPSEAGAIVNWEGGVFDGKLPNMDLTSSSTLKVPVPGADQPIPDPVNPQTKDMLAKLLAWKFQAPVHITGTTPAGPAGVIYVIDTASWQLVYDHFLANRLTPPMSRDQAIASFQALAGHDPSGLITDASKVEVQLEQALINGVIQDIPNFPSPIAFQIFAEAGWTYHTEPGSGGVALYGRRDAGSLVLNLQTLRALIKPDDQGKRPDFFDFTVTYDSAGSAIDGGMELGFYIKGKNKDETNDYPVISDVAKLDTAFDVGVSHAIPSGGAVTVRVTFAKKNPDTGVITPPSVDIINDTGTTGGHTIG